MQLNHGQFFLFLFVASKLSWEWNWFSFHIFGPVLQLEPKTVHTFLFSSWLFRGHCVWMWSFTGKNDCEIKEREKSLKWMDICKWISHSGSTVTQICIWKWFVVWHGIWCMCVCVCVRQQEESRSAEGRTGQTEGCIGLQGRHGEETSWWVALCLWITPWACSLVHTKCKSPSLHQAAF